MPRLLLADSYSIWSKLMDLNDYISTHRSWLMSSSKFLVWKRSSSAFWTFVNCVMLLNCMLACSRRCCMLCVTQLRLSMRWLYNSITWETGAECSSLRRNVSPMLSIRTLTRCAISLSIRVRWLFRMALRLCHSFDDSLLVVGVTLLLLLLLLLMLDTCCKR